MMTFCKCGLVAFALADTVYYQTQVSAFIVCLITLDRLIVVRFPFSRRRFTAFHAHLASLLAWTAGLAIAGIHYDDDNDDDVMVKELLLMKMLMVTMMIMIMMIVIIIKTNQYNSNNNNDNDNSNTNYIKPLQKPNRA